MRLFLSTFFAWINSLTAIPYLVRVFVIPVFIVAPEVSVNIQGHRISRSKLCGEPTSLIDRTLGIELCRDVGAADDHTAAD